MNYIILCGNVIPPFIMFSRIHILTISALLILFMSIYLTRNKIKRNGIDKAIRYFAAIALILLEISTILFNFTDNQWTWAYSLPLQLCDILVVLSALMLVTGSYRLYEFVYFPGLAGATQAIITPYLTQGFPSIRFFEFFISHGLIVFSALYMTFVHGYRPNVRSIFRTLVGLNISVPFVGLIDYFTGGDYFFLASKPTTASLLNYLGPWPWYLLSLEFVAIILSFVLYLPFAFKDMIDSKDKREKSPL